MLYSIAFYNKNTEKKVTYCIQIHQQIMGHVKQTRNVNKMQFTHKHSHNQALTFLIAKRDFSLCVHSQKAWNLFL